MRKKTKLEYASAIDGYEFARDKVDDIHVSLSYHNQCRSHFHKQMECLYVLGGKITVELNKQVNILKRGDFVICNSFDLHSFTQTKPTLTFVISIPTNFLFYFEKCAGGSSFDGNIIRKCSLTKRLYKIMRQFGKSVNSGATKLLGLTLLLFGEIATKLNITSGKTKEETLIYKIIRYIEDNYKEPITLGSLAAYCGYSKNYISKEFNTSFNCNINEFINLKRLQAFIALHETNKDTVTTNALAVGFNSVRTFYNVFNEHFGMSPKEYFGAKQKEA